MEVVIHLPRDYEAVSVTYDATRREIKFSPEFAGQSASLGRITVIGKGGAVRRYRIRVGADSGFVYADPVKPRRSHFDGIPAGTELEPHIPKKRKTNRQVQPQMCPHQPQSAVLPENPSENVTRDEKS